MSEKKVKRFEAFFHRDMPGTMVIYASSKEEAQIRARNEDADDWIYPELGEGGISSIEEIREVD